MREGTDRPSVPRWIGWGCVHPWSSTTDPSPAANPGVILMPKMNGNRRDAGASSNSRDTVRSKLTGHARTQAQMCWIDSVPYYVSQLSLRLPRLHGIILMHLWHLTVGNHKPNAIVPHSALEALLGTKRYEEALTDLKAWGIIRREKLLHKGRTTWCYALEVVYAKWHVPAEYTTPLDVIAEQDLWRADSVDHSDLHTEQVSWRTYDERIRSVLEPPPVVSRSPQIEELSWDSVPAEAPTSPLLERGEAGGAAPYPGGVQPPTGTGATPLLERGEDEPASQQPQGLTGSPNIYCSTQRDQQGGLPPPADLECTLEENLPAPSPDGRGAGREGTASENDKPGFDPSGSEPGTASPRPGAEGQTTIDSPSGVLPPRGEGLPVLKEGSETRLSLEFVLASRLQLWAINCQTWNAKKPEYVKEMREAMVEFGKCACRDLDLDWEQIKARLNDKDAPLPLFDKNDHGFIRGWSDVDRKLTGVLPLVWRKLCQRFEIDMRQEYEKRGLTPPPLGFPPGQDPRRS